MPSVLSAIEVLMFDALMRARRLRRCALKSLQFADRSASAEVARHYRLIFQHYVALARLVEQGQYPDRRSPEIDEASQQDELTN